MITIIGLGSSDETSLSEEAKNALLSSSQLYLRTSNHPSVRWLDMHNIKYKSFDTLYELSSNFNELYNKIAERILDVEEKDANISYAVPGHPLVGEEAVRIIIETCRTKSIEYNIISTQSFIEPVMEAVGTNLSDGIQVWNAYTIEKYQIDVRLPQIIYQLDSQDIASNLKLYISELYSDEYNVAVVRSAGSETQEILWLPIYELDRVEHNPLTSLFIPAKPMRWASGVEGLRLIIAALRAPDGCPWDREQTHESLKGYAVEESYELLDAIDIGDPENICEELGDMLLQVVLHSQIAEETGEFNLRDVANLESEKLIRRHPHVFGDIKVKDSDEVLHNWEQIKKLEKGGNLEKSMFSDIPKCFPALMRALELSMRAAKVGFEWENLEGVFEKLEEEKLELLEACQIDDKNRIEEEIGDILFTIVNIARHKNVNPELALRSMTNRFINRFKLMELDANGKDLNNLSAQEWDDLWISAKLKEQNNAS